MPDMLVKLYELPPVPQIDGVTVRVALAPERHHVLGFVREAFNEGWVSEAAVTLDRTPASCLVAIEDGKVVGFACYDAIKLGFFGPTGVLESERGRGIGTALLIATLEEQRHAGHGYSIIGSAGPVTFYEEAVGATAIPGSSPGVYEGLLRDG